MIGALDANGFRALLLHETQQYFFSAANWAIVSCPVYLATIAYDWEARAVQLVVKRPRTYHGNRGQGKLQRHVIRTGEASEDRRRIVQTDAHLS